MLTALLWAVHPLQTESVVYVTQRTELMVGLFYLATVYGSLRYWSAKSGRGRGLWLGLSTLACLAGMSCKEVMATAPIVVLLLERTLIAGSFRATLRQSWPLYVGLAMGWVLLAALNYDAPRSASAGFHLGVPAYVWWFTQSKVLWMYFKLAVWPWPLLIHYYVPYVETFGEAWPWLLASTALGVATLALIWRRRATGLAGAWVLLILSPTLVVPIITEVAAERRMYLPLAGIVLLGTAGGFLLVRRAIFWIGDTEQTVGAVKPGRATAMVAAAGIMLAIVWSVVNVHRLVAFQDPIALWQDTIREAAVDSFAYNNLGYELVTAQRLQEAMQPLQQALTLDSSDPKIYTNLGMALDGLGRPEEAIEEFQKALKIDPGYAVAKRDLALSLAKAGRAKDEIAELEALVNMHPEDATAHYDLGIALGQTGRFPEAIEQFQRAVAIRPGYAAAYNNCGVALVKLNRPGEAIQVFERAVALEPKNGEARKNLGVSLVTAGRPLEAIQHFEELLRLDPENAIAIEVAIGDAYLSANKRREAIATLQRALTMARSQGKEAAAQEIENRLKSLGAAPAGGK
jgi:tetratricopeptide (TPR) repeat protein